jgi:hypothetical protein
MNNCLQCGVNTKNPKFCSKSCSASWNNKKVPKKKKKSLKIAECLNCSKVFEYSSYYNKGKYCSNSCQVKFQRSQIIEKWKQNPKSSIRAGYKISSVIKNYLIEKAESCCSLCGWSEINQYTGNVPLEIHHIDGDCSNNAEENLQVLCPNCHSLSHNYKGANKSKASSIRSKYFKVKQKENNGSIA